MEFRINKKKEHRKFTFPPNNKHNKYDDHTSYSCFIMFKDKKILFGTRTHTFYCTYIGVTLNKKIINDLQKQKISACIKNLNLIEFLDFLMALIHQNIIQASIYFSKKEINKLIEINKNNRFRFFKNIVLKNLLDEDNSELLFEIKRILFDFRDWYFENKIIKGFKLDNNCTIVLLGGKKEKGENCKETIVREIMEEINLNIDINEVSFLNQNLKFVDFKNNNIISPIMDCLTKDKVLNHTYNDKIFVLKIDKNYSDTVKRFTPTLEIGAVIVSDIQIDYDNMDIESLKKIIKSYKYIKRINVYKCI